MKLTLHIPGTHCNEERDLRVFEVMCGQGWCGPVKMELSDLVQLRDAAQRDSEALVQWLDNIIGHYCAP